MKVTDLAPVGGSVSDLSIGGLAPADARQLETLLARHGVLFVSGQQVGDAPFIAFLESFGALAFTKGETPVADFPDLNVVTNVGRSRPPRSSFHIDTSYVRRPPTYTALRAVAVPERGGATLFSNQYRAYDTLPSPLRHKLEGRTIRHVVSGVEFDEGDEIEAEHPIFLRHPISGRTALYLTTPVRCAAISGLSSAEAEATIATLFDHATRDDNTYRHHWSPGDVVIWDNRCVMHRADHAEVVGDRVLHRGTVTA